MKQNEQSRLSCNMCSLSAGGKELEDRAGEIFHEIMAESFSNLVKDLVSYRFGKHCELQAKNKYREKPHLNIIRLPKW